MSLCLTRTSLASSSSLCSLSQLLYMSKITVIFNLISSMFYLKNFIINIIIKIIIIIIITILINAISILLMAPQHYHFQYHRHNHRYYYYHYNHITFIVIIISYKDQNHQIKAACFIWKVTLIFSRCRSIISTAVETRISW